MGTQAKHGQGKEEILLVRVVAAVIEVVLVIGGSGSVCFFVALY